MLRSRGERRCLCAKKHTQHIHRRSRRAAAATSNLDIFLSLLTHEIQFQLIHLMKTHWPHASIENKYQHTIQLIRRTKIYSFTRTLAHAYSIPNVYSIYWNSVDFAISNIKLCIREWMMCVILDLLLHVVYSHFYCFRPPKSVSDNI